MERPRLKLTFLKDDSFWILQLGNVIPSLSFLVPSIYFRNYVKQLGFEGTISARPIVLLNIEAVIGSITMGTIIDRHHVATGILISTIGAFASVFQIWGVLHVDRFVVEASVRVRYLAGSSTITWPGALRLVQRSIGQVESPMIYSFLSFGRVDGKVSSGPMSDVLIKARTIGGMGLYGTKYGSLVVYTGVHVTFGRIGVLGKQAG
jgi:hypothetical protein